MFESRLSYRECIEIMLRYHENEGFIAFGKLNGHYVLYTSYCPLQLGNIKVPEGWQIEGKTLFSKQGNNVLKMPIRVKVNL